MAKDNVAARLGGWSARHRAAAILGWLVMVVALTMLGANVSSALTGVANLLP